MLSAEALNPYKKTACGTNANATLNAKTPEPCTKNKSVLRIIFHNNHFSRGKTLLERGKLEL